MKTFIFNILILTLLSGCSMVKPLFKLPDEKTTTQIVAFQDLLKQGWKLYIVENRVVLIKYTNNNELLVEDIFNIRN